MTGQARRSRDGKWYVSLYRMRCIPVSQCNAIWSFLGILPFNFGYSAFQTKISIISWNLHDCEICRYKRCLFQLLHDIYLNEFFVASLLFMYQKKNHENCFRRNLRTKWIISIFFCFTKSVKNRNICGQKQIIYKAS